MQAILFDLDGTLIDSSEGITKSAQYALKSKGVQAKAEDLLCFIGPPLDGSFMKHYGFSKEEAKELIIKYRERYNEKGVYECKLYPGVEATLKELKQAGYRIGMASSKPEVACRRIMQYHGVFDLFDDIVGATEDGRIATKEQVLSEVFRRWEDIPKEEMCLVGDTIYDVDGAKCHGLPCIAVSFGFGDMDEMLQAGAVARCDDLTDLPRLLRELEERQ